MKELFKDILDSSVESNILQNKQLIERCEQIYNLLELNESKKYTDEYKHAVQVLNQNLIKLIRCLDEEKLKKYISPEKISEYKFNSVIGIDMLMRFSPEQLDRLLTPDIYMAYNFQDYHLKDLFKYMGKDISKKYFFKGQHFEFLGRYELGIENVIKSKAKNLEEYLTIENIRRYKLNNKAISKIIDNLDEIEKKKYFFKGERNRKFFSVANIIQNEKPANIEDYLTIDCIKEFALDDQDINNLVSCLDESDRKKYQIREGENSKIGVRNIYYYNCNPQKRKVFDAIYEEHRGAFKDSCDILENDYLFEKFDISMISYISSFRNESEKMANASKTSLDLIGRILEKFEIDNQTDEWMYLLDILIRKFYVLEKIIKRCKIDDVESLDDRIIENITKVVIDGDHIPDTKEDLINYEQKLISNLPEFNYETFLADITCEENPYYKDESNKQIYSILLSASGNSVYKYEFSKQIDSILQSKFGISFRDAIGILREYGKDIDSFENEDLKAFMKSIDMLIQFFLNRNSDESVIVLAYDDDYFFRDKGQTIIPIEIAEKLLQEYGNNVENIENKRLQNFMERLIAKDDSIIISDCLKNIAEEVEPIPEEHRLNTISLAKQLKKEYMKLYLPTLLSADDCQSSQLGENTYELPVDSNGDVKKFNILLTSLGAFRETPNVNENYYDKWNRKNITSLHFCASYIGRQMLSLAPIPDICYGFNTINEDSLLLSSNEDIGSSDDKMASTYSGKTKYYNPEHQIDYSQNGGGSCTCVRNEMDIRRTVGNQKIQPDYIVVFRTNGIIKNMHKAKKAQQDFKGVGINLPIIIVDSNKCLEAEKHEIDKMKEEYKKNPSKELQKKINTKIKTNNHTIRYIQEVENIPIEFSMGEEVGDTDEQSKYTNRKSISILSAMEECAGMVKQEEQTQMMNRFIGLKRIVKQEYNNERCNR